MLGEMPGQILAKTKGGDAAGTVVARCILCLDTNGAKQAQNQLVGAGRARAGKSNRDLPF